MKELDETSKVDRRELELSYKLPSTILKNKRRCIRKDFELAVLAITEGCYSLLLIGLFHELKKYFKLLFRLHSARLAIAEYSDAHLDLRTSIRKICSFTFKNSFDGHDHFQYSTVIQTNQSGSRSNIENIKISIEDDLKQKFSFCLKRHFT